MKDPIDLNEAHNILFERYLEIFENNIQCSLTFSEEDLTYYKKMCLTSIKETMPIDKKARWLGFIQGVLIISGILTIKEEREISRPLFSKFYDNPKTINI